MIGVTLDDVLGDLIFRISSEDNGTVRKGKII